ncbi:GNAT family N-acetyltransferase [Chryseobacterium sp. CT-SW4]|uniref:GNAT family N-acetyltransferase n=1 Tax=Chryseobacterium sp. SW-1 TaxID=3157343 RepID=UPI003B023985
MNMIEADKTHEKIIVEILTESFENVMIDNSINFIVGFGKNRKKKLKRLFTYQFKMALMFGKVFTNDDINSVILFIHTKKFTLKRLLLEIHLAFNVIGIMNILKVLKREKVLKMSHSSSDYIHLWLMGTRPSQQGKGTGTTLLRKVLEYYRGKVIILETTAPENVVFYRKSGFDVFEENHALNYPLYFMRHV